MDKTCENCKYFVMGSAYAGSCKRYPPTPIGVGFSDRTEHPWVLMGNWCGEFKRKSK